jgi:hypothetical protein
MLILSDRSYALHFSLFHRWICFLELPILGDHLTEICTQAISDFFSSLIKRKGERECSFFFLSVNYKAGIELYMISFSFYNEPLRI